MKPRKRAGWHEVQPPLRPMPPSKARLFKPAGARHSAPTNGVAPLAEAPTCGGWWAVKYPTAARPFLMFFRDNQRREMEDLHRDNLAFYPFTPLTHPKEKAQPVAAS